MSQTVGLLYPDSAQSRAALAGRRPGSDNCWGLNSAKRSSTAISVIPITAMAAPGSGSRTRPTITPTKIEKKYHAWGARPEGTGNSARMTAIATGANAFHSGVLGRASKRTLGVTTVSLEGGTCTTLLIVVFETPISFLFEIDSVFKT